MCYGKEFGPKGFGFGNAMGFVVSFPAPPAPPDGATLRHSCDEAPLCLLAEVSE